MGQSIVTNGLVGIKLGDLAADGGPATTLVKLGNTMQDSCSLIDADPESTDFFAEEFDLPMFSKNKQGARKLSFQIMDPDVDVLAKVFGGTVTGTTTKVWNAPVKMPTIEQTVEITMESGFDKLTINRGSVTAKINSQIGKKNIFLVDITVVALQPIKAGVPGFSTAQRPTA